MNPIFTPFQNSLLTPRLLLYCQKTISETDPYQSVGIVLCCALSWTPETKSAAMELIKAHFPALVKFVSDDQIVNVVNTVVSRVIGCEEWNVKDSGALTKLVKMVQNESSVLAWHVITATLKTSNTEQLHVKNLWKVARQILNSEEGQKMPSSRLAPSYQYCMALMLELIGRYGLSSSSLLMDTYKEFFQLFGDMCSRVRLDAVPAPVYDVMYLLVVVFSAIHEETGKEPFKQHLTQLLDAIIDCNVAGSQFLSELKSMVDVPPVWFSDNGIDAKRVICSMLLFGLKHSGKLHSLAPYAADWISALFPLLVSCWPSIQREYQYPSLLESLAEITFKFSMAPSGVNMDCLRKIVSACQEHLFSSHPVLHNLSLDLWCVVLQNSSTAATKDVPRQLSALALHIVNRYFPSLSASSSRPLSSTMLYTLNPIRLKLKSILFRALACVPEHSRPEIDGALSGTPLFRILNVQGEPTLGDGDLFLLSVLPLSLMPRNSRYDHVLSLLVEMLSLTATLKTDDGVARNWLCMRAIHSLLGDSKETWTSATLGTLYRLATQTFQNAARGEFVDGNFMACFFDIFSLPPLRERLTWKKLLLDLGAKFHLFPNIAKIALVQYISASAVSCAYSELEQIAEPLTDIFNTFCMDSDWIVAAEAIVAFYPLSKKISLDIENKDRIQELFETYLQAEEKPVPLNTKQSKCLDALAVTPDLTDALDTFKAQMLRFAEERIGSSTEDQSLLQELLKTAQRLRTLESSIAASNSTIL